MPLNEGQKKRLSDIARGKGVNSKISLEDQIAALRKQIIALSTAAKVPLCANFKVLVDLVESEKAKKEKKVETVKPAKKTAKKSK